MKNRKQLFLCGEYITYTDRKHAVGFYYTVNGKTGIHIYAKDKKYESDIQAQFGKLAERMPLDEDCEFEWRSLLSDFKNEIRQI